MHFDHNKCHGILLLLLCVGFVSLWNGTKGPLILDDFRNLSPLINSDKPDYLNVIFSNESGPLGRSVSMATFAANHWIRDGIVASDLKVTNLIIHLINAFLLYHVIILLLKSRYKSEQRYMLAIAITACWFLSPINTSVVFYAVQRMAMLSTLFVLAGCLIYLKYRSRSFNWSNRTIFSCSLLFICWMLASLSKENGLLLPFFIIAIELCFFDELRVAIGNIKRIKKVLYISGVVLFCCSTIALASLNGYLDYGNFDYNLSERLFTQPVVLVKYIYRLLLPFNMDIGLYFDDVVVLTTFWNLKTLASTLLINIFILIICYSLLSNKFRYISFGLLFFLTGHSIESTIFPLEMYYYHRNYLPSIGFYFFLVLTVFECFFYVGKSRLLMAVLGSYFSLFGFFSYEISKVWVSKERIVVNASYYHPYSIRTSMEMVELLRQKGKLKQALRINEDIIEHRHGDAFRPVLQRIYLHCRANLSLAQVDYDRLSVNIDRFHALEISNAFMNIVDIRRGRKCDGVNFIEIVNRLSRWLDEKLVNQTYTPGQVWHLEYYIIELLLVLQRKDLALQRLERHSKSYSLSEIEFFRATIEQNQD